MKNTMHLLLAVTITAFAQAASATEVYWLKISAKNKFERTQISNTGATLDVVKDDYVIVYADQDLYNVLKKETRILAKVSSSEEKNLRFSHPTLMGTKKGDFPAGEDLYSTYAELTTALKKLAVDNPSFVSLSSIGQTSEKRELWMLRIGTEQNLADQKPGVIYMGGHHAREHLSVDVPLKWAQYLVSEYNKGNQQIVSLVQSRDIHIIPLVNPDGAEYDISGDKYKLWRKSRVDYKTGHYGVDLNRNYGYKWGQDGASKNPKDDTYRGPSAFSEPETQAIKKYIEDHVNITTLQTTHTFSKLILYPWGHTYDPIQDAQGRLVHEKMAAQMSKWNGYKAQSSSDLYLTSGDTTDWSWGEHKIISFTFELDPASDMESLPGLNLGSIFTPKCEGGFVNPACLGFYPGEKFIQSSFDKNIKPFTFLLEYADNPYRFLTNP